MPAQSSRSIGFLMLVGSSLTLCGLICNNNAMLSPSLLRLSLEVEFSFLLVTHSSVCLVCEIFKRNTLSLDNH